MESYFTAIQPHLEGRTDIAIITVNQSPNIKAITSLGIDNLIYLKDLTHSQQDRIALSEDFTYTCIARAVNNYSCFLGTQDGQVFLYDMQSKSFNKIFPLQSVPNDKSFIHKVNGLTLSPNRRYLAVSTQQQKCNLIDLTNSYKVSKCRPGHEKGVVNVYFSYDQKYLASIGQDRYLILFNIENFDVPVEMYRYKICKNEAVDPFNLSGDFNKLLPIFYSSGSLQLQIIQLLNDRWQYRVSSNIKHPINPIQLVKIIKHYIMITSCSDTVLIWNNKNQEKLIVIQQFNLTKTIEFNDKFFGSRNDGNIYQYKRILTQNQTIIPSQTNKMQIQQQPHPAQQGDQDIICFNMDQDNQQEQEDKQQQEKAIQDHKYELQKKSKADKIVTAYPQTPLINSTSLFDNSRYLYTSQFGYLIEKRQSENQIRIQFQSEDEKQNQLLFINKEIFYADFNNVFVAYANQTAYGIKFLGKFSEFESWQKSWWDIIAVACSNSWIAVANQQEIKIIDLTGNQLKCICFDRQMLAIAAYESLLTVVYHESIPIWGSQCLAMQTFVVNDAKNDVIKCNSCQVPVRPKKQLKFFRFTQQGMIVAQDTDGFIRIYNLENNTWTSVFVEGIEDARRLWLLGMKNYQLIYWKTTQLNPDPQVFPRLPLKESRLGITVAVEQSEDMQKYPFLLFERFILDHQKCRSRLWYHYKLSRGESHPAHYSSSSILSVIELTQKHKELDYKFYDVIKYYLKAKSIIKAYTSVKSLIRTLQAGKNMIQVFDSFKLRNYSVELERYYDQKQKQLQYEVIQQMQLQSLKQQAQKKIKPKAENAFAKKKGIGHDMSSIPSLNSSQISTGSNFDGFSQISQIKKKQNGMGNANKKIILDTPQKQQFVNPFLKRTSTDQDMSMKNRQIQDQIEKFGVKKKADIKKSRHL